MPNFSLQHQPFSKERSRLANIPLRQRDIAEVLEQRCNIAPHACLSHQW
jgi:hypothetical protein